MLDHKLYTFIKVTEVGSFSKAAAELNLTQPAISQQIRQLETELGVPLLIRSHGSFTLTPQGKIALRYARSFVKSYHGMWAEFDDLHKENRHVVVGITPIAQSSPLVDLLVDCSAEHENLKFSMYEQSPNRICSLVRDGVVSWGILDSMPDDSVLQEGLQFLVLDTEPLMCVLPPSHPLAAETSITIDVLLHERMILPQPKYTSTALFGDALQQAGRSLDELHIILETDDVAALKRFTAEGLGITVLPASCCTREVQQGSLVLRPLHNLHVLNQLCLIYSDGSRNLDLMQELADRYHRQQIESHS